MIIQNVQINFRRKLESQKIDDRNFAAGRRPYFTSITSEPRWPTDVPSAGTIEFRNKAVQQSSLVMYKETSYGWHTINITSVPYQAIRLFLEGRYKKAADLSIYDSHIFCEYDRDPNYSEEHRISDDDANESYLLDKIALKLKKEFEDDDDLWDKYQDELNSPNSGDNAFKKHRISILERYLEQYAFYFIYNSVNYRDAWVLFSPVFPNKSDIDMQQNKPSGLSYQDEYNSYIDNNSNFLSSWNQGASCNKFFLLKNRYIFTKNIPLASGESFTWDYTEFQTKRIEYITWYQVSHGFVFKANYSVPFAVHPGYDGVKDIEKDIAFFYANIEKDIAFFYANSEPNQDYNNLNAANIMRYIYRYLDSSENNKKKAIGFGFVACHQQLVGGDDELNGHDTFVSNIFTNFGGALQYVPVLTGLLRFLVAVKLGYKPLIYLVDSNPTYKNLITEQLIKEREVNNTYQNYLKKRYYRKIEIVKDENEIVIKEQGSDGRFSIEYPLDITKINFLCFYLAPFSTEDWISAFSQPNYKINIWFDYYTSSEMLPCFLTTNSEKLLEMWTNETDNSITDLERRRNIDYRYIINGGPVGIFYSLKQLERPFVYKRANVLEVEFNTQLNTPYVSELPDYKYDIIKDFLTSPPYATSASQFFANNVVYSYLSSTNNASISNIKTPVFITDFLYPGDEQTIKSFSFITTGRILNYPSLFSGNFSNINADSIHPQEGVYFMEILYEKYVRAMLLYSIIYLSMNWTNITFPDMTITIKSDKIDRDEDGKKKRFIEAAVTMKTFATGAINNLVIVIDY